MLFNTSEFFILLVVTLGVFYIGSFFLGRQRGRLQVWILLLASFLFYAWEEPQLLILLFVSILVNTAVCRCLARADKHGVRKRLVVGGVTFNLLCLGFFKYASLIATLFPDWLLAEGVKVELKSIPLPIGISFYTFQALSLIIDIYRDNKDQLSSLKTTLRQPSFILSFERIGFYIAFFPQLIAGPIVKAHEFFHQIKMKNWLDVHLSKAVKCLIIGFFLKVFVADNLNLTTATLGQGELATMGAINLMVLLYGYSFQIFADFAGYSLIAIGLGALFGYKLPDNFRFPYIATSFARFWHRWHISLSTWLREYLYFPLGGNRKGAVRTYVNLLLVMSLGGLWHGHTWNYLAWGVVQGLFLLIERFFSLQKKEAREGVLLLVIRALIVFHLITFSWLFFVMPDINQVGAFFLGLVDSSQPFGVESISKQTVFAVGVYSLPVIVYHIYGLYSEQRQAREKDWCLIKDDRLKAVLLAVLLFLTLLNAGPTADFVYFQF